MRGVEFEHLLVVRASAVAPAEGGIAIAEQKVGVGIARRILQTALQDRNGPLGLAEADMGQGHIVVKAGLVWSQRQTSFGHF